MTYDLVTRSLINISMKVTYVLHNRLHKGYHEIEDVSPKSETDIRNAVKFWLNGNFGEMYDFVAKFGDFR